MLMLFNNLFALGVLFLAWLYVFKFCLRKNKLMSKTIRIFLLLHVILVAFIITEQHRFKTNLANSLFIDDGEIYSSNAWQISTALTGAIPDIHSVAKMRGIHLADRSWGLERYYNDYIKKKIIPSASEYHIRYITYLYSVIYAAYGFTPAVVNFMNVILHLLTAILIYKSVTLIFDDKVAYISTIFFLLNPISFFYSSTKLQDSMVIFLVYLSIHCFLIFLKKKNYWYLLSIFPLFYIIYSFSRSYYLIPLLAAFIATTVTIIFKRNKKLFSVLVVFIFLSLIGTHASMLPKAKFYIRSSLRDSVIHQRGFYNTGGQVYQLFIPGKDAQDYTLKNWAGYALRGWYHMLSEPILSPVISIKLILLYPIKIVFLILCALSLPGILMAMRYGYTESVIFISIFVILGTGIAMSSGNVGTMLRHRDIITPVVFIFSAFYITRFWQATGLNNMRKG